MCIDNIGSGDSTGFGFSTTGNSKDWSLICKVGRSDDSAWTSWCAELIPTVTPRYMIQGNDWSVVVFSMGGSRKGILQLERRYILVLEKPCSRMWSLEEDFDHILSSILW